MITYKESKISFGRDRKSEEMKADEFIITANCSWLPDNFKTPFRGNMNQVNIWKEGIERTTLILLANNMLKQRLENYNHGEYAGNSGEKVKILQKAREGLDYYRNLEFGEFLNMYKKIVIPAMHQIIPNLDSSIYTLYNDKLTAIEKYLISKNKKNE